MIRTVERPENKPDVLTCPKDTKIMSIVEETTSFIGTKVYKMYLYECDECDECGEQIYYSANREYVLY